MTAPARACPAEVLDRIQSLLLDALADAQGASAFDGPRNLRMADQIRLRHLRRWHAAECALLEAEATTAAIHAAAKACAQAAGDEKEDHG